MNNFMPIYDVALSFAGEDRKYVEKVADFLREMELKVFYDKFERNQLWGKDLYEYLIDIYSKRAKYTVMFISKHYAEKRWPNHERKAAQERAFTENSEYILPARFDDTEIPGLLKTIGYLDLRKISPKELAEEIKRKLGRIERFDFFPIEPGLLIDFMEIPDEEEISDEDFDRFIETSYIVARQLFDDFKLMTPEERKLVHDIVNNACVIGSPEFFHVNLEYLQRVVSMDREEILSNLSRLDCLGIESRVLLGESPEEDSISGSRELLEIKYVPRIVEGREMGSSVMFAIFRCMHDRLCPKCVEAALDRMDLSILSESAGFPEEYE